MSKRPFNPNEPSEDYTPPKPPFDPNEPSEDYVPEKPEEEKEGFFMGTLKDTAKKIAGAPEAIVDLVKSGGRAVSEFTGNPFEATLAGVYEGARQASGGLIDKALATQAFTVNSTMAGGDGSFDPDDYKARLNDQDSAGKRLQEKYPGASQVGGVVGNALTGAAVTAATGGVGALPILAGMTASSVAGQGANQGNVTARDTVSDLGAGAFFGGAVKGASKAANAVKQRANDFSTALNNKAMINSKKSMVPEEVAAMERLSADTPDARMTRQTDLAHNRATVVDNANNFETLNKELTDWQNSAIEQRTSNQDGMSKQRFKTETEAKEAAIQDVNNQIKRTRSAVNSQASKDVGALQPEIEARRGAINTELETHVESLRNQEATGTAESAISQLRNAAMEAEKAIGGSGKSVTDIAIDAENVLLKRATASDRYQQAAKQAEINKVDLPDPLDFVTQADEVMALVQLQRRLGAKGQFDNLSRSSEGQKFINGEWRKAKGFIDALPDNVKTGIQDATAKFADTYKLEDQLKANALQKLPSTERGKRNEYAPSTGKIRRTLDDEQRASRLTEGIAKYSPERGKVIESFETAKAFKNAPNPEALRTLIGEYLEKSSPEQAVNFQQALKLANADVSPVNLVVAEKQGLINSETARMYKDFLTVAKAKTEAGSGIGKAGENISRGLNFFGAPGRALGIGVRAMTGGTTNALDLIQKQGTLERSAGVLKQEAASIKPSLANPTGAATASALTPSSAVSDSEKDKVLRGFRDKPNVASWLKIISNGSYPVREDSVKSAASNLGINEDRLREALFKLGKNVQP